MFSMNGDAGMRPYSCFIILCFPHSMQTLGKLCCSFGNQSRLCLVITRKHPHCLHKVCELCGWFCYLVKSGRKKCGSIRAARQKFAGFAVQTANHSNYAYGNAEASALLAKKFASSAGSSAWKSNIFEVRPAKTHFRNSMLEVKTVSVIIRFG